MINRVQVVQIFFNECICSNIALQILFLCEYEAVGGRTTVSGQRLSKSNSAPQTSK